MPIVQILAGEVELAVSEWPVPQVDAVMMRRPGQKPAVFYKNTDPRGLRQRFTLAHELGHLKLAWHLGNKACEVAPSETGSDRANGRPPEEREADTFASCLLVPDRWLEAVSRTYGEDMTGLLEAVSTAQVSTTASLLALRRGLSAGWAFQLNSRPDLITSAGTVTPVAGPAELTRSAEDHGVYVLQGNNVRWWRLAGRFDIPAEDDDPRSTTELLRSAIRSHESDPARAKWIEQSANGKVGGGTKDDAGRPAGEVFASLTYRFRYVEYAAMTTHPDFQKWLTRKARDKANK